MRKKNDPYMCLSRAANGTAPNLEANPVARAVFGYYGSKQRLSKKILKHLPPHHCWVELFCGSAAITMAKSPAKIEIINDLDQEIINAFRQLRQEPERLIEAITLTPYAKDEFHIAMYGADNVPDDLERARRFLTKAMMAVNGVLAKSKGGFSFTNSYSRNGKEARVNRWVNYPQRLQAVVQRIREVRIENRDAVQLLKEFSNRPATLVYIDPPYLTKRSAGYTVDIDNDQFHIDLLHQANVSKCMILVSSYESTMYSQLLSTANGWSKVKIDTSTRATNGSALKRNEILWMNAAAKKAHGNNKVPIKLTTKEKQDQKINPTRGPIRQHGRSPRRHSTRSTA